MTNRKKSDTYRFNGLYGIKPVTTAELERRIAELRAKLADPADSDDKKWTAGWLKRHEQELDKKRRGMELKAASRKR